jgi:hypothetical protein
MDKLVKKLMSNPDSYDFVVLCCVGALPKKDQIDPWCLVSGPFALGSFALKVGPFALIIKKYLNEHNKYCNVLIE